MMLYLEIDFYLFIYFFHSLRQYVNLMRDLQHQHLVIVTMKNTTVLPPFTPNHYIPLKYLYFV